MSKCKFKYCSGVDCAGLPKAAGFSARIDSSLGGGTLPEEDIERIGSDLVKACADGASAITACLQVGQLLPSFCLSTNPKWCW